MTSKAERPCGWLGPLTFWKVGALLLTAFLIFGGIWLAMRAYQIQVEAEYREISMLVITQEASADDIEQFQELAKRYRDVSSVNYHSFAWSQQRIGTTAVIAGVGSFLWLLTLLRKGIVWLAGRMK